MKTTKFELGGALFQLEADGHYKQLYRISGDRKDLLAEYVTDAFGGLAINEMDCVGILAFIENVAAASALNEDDIFPPMPAEKIDREKAFKLRDFSTPMDRKVGSLQDVTAKLVVAVLPADLREVLENLPVLNVPHNIALLTDFLDGEVQYYILKTYARNGETDMYFVDTQGYDYARYITKIV